MSSLDHCVFKKWFLLFKNIKALPYRIRDPCSPRSSYHTAASQMLPENQMSRIGENGSFLLLLLTATVLQTHTTSRLKDCTCTLFFLKDLSIASINFPWCFPINRVYGTKADFLGRVGSLFLPSQLTGPIK